MERGTRLLVLLWFVFYLFFLLAFCHLPYLSTRLIKRRFFLSFSQRKKKKVEKNFGDPNDRREPRRSFRSAVRNSERNNSDVGQSIRVHIHRQVFGVGELEDLRFHVHKEHASQRQHNDRNGMKTIDFTIAEKEEKKSFFLFCSITEQNEIF